MDKDKKKLMEQLLAPEKKNGSTAADHAVENDEVITIVVNSEHYQIEIEIY